MFDTTDGFFGIVESSCDKAARITAESVEKEAAALAREHRAAQLIRRIELFDNAEREPLKPLTGSSGVDRERLLGVANKQPFVAYALLVRHLDAIIVREEADLAARQARLEEVPRLPR